MIEKKENINYFKLDKEIEMLSSDEERINLLDNYEDVLYSTQLVVIIMQIEDDSLRMDLLDKYFDKLDSNKVMQIIINVKNDDYRTKMIDKYVSKLEDFEVGVAISTISDIYLRFQYVDKYINRLNEFGISRAISKKDLIDEQKIEWTQKYKHKLSDRSICQIVASYTSDELKLRYIEENVDRLDNISLGEIINGMSDNLIKDFVSRNCDESEEKFEKSPIGLPEEMTIGVEIEFEGFGARLLTKKSNKTLEEVLNFSEKEKEAFNRWDGKNDMSLNFGMGRELTSPPFNDTIQNWEELYHVCNVLNRAKSRIVDTCSVHVHIGADILGCDNKAWENLFTIWSTSEEIIYKMSNQQFEQSRYGVLKHAKSVSDTIQKVLDRGSINITSLKDMANLYNTEYERKTSLNLSHAGEENKNTIEFRLSNGSIDPNIIKENVTLYGSVVKAAVYGARNHGYKSEQFERLKDRELTEEERAKVLMDLLFDSEETRNIFMKRFYSVKDGQIYNEVFLPQNRHSIQNNEEKREEHEL